MTGRLLVEHPHRVVGRGQLASQVLRCARTYRAKLEWVYAGPLLAWLFRFVFRFPAQIWRIGLAIGATLFIGTLAEEGSRRTALLSSSAFPLGVHLSLSAERDMATACVS
jgi:hypothetical protein